MGIGKWFKKRKMMMKLQRHIEFYEGSLEIKKIVDRKKELVDDGMLVDLSFDTLMMERLKIGELSWILEQLGSQTDYEKGIEISITNSLNTIVQNQELDKKLITSTYHYMIGNIEGNERVIKQIKQEIKEL